MSVGATFDDGDMRRKTVATVLLKISDDCEAMAERAKSFKRHSYLSEQAFVWRLEAQRIEQGKSPLHGTTLAASVQAAVRGALISVPRGAGGMVNFQKLLPEQYMDW